MRVDIKLKLSKDWKDLTTEELQHIKEHAEFFYEDILDTIDYQLQKRME